MKKGDSITKENYEELVETLRARELHSSGMQKTASVTFFLEKWFEE